jgi:hypothetical protein
MTLTLKIRIDASRAKRVLGKVKDFCLDTGANGIELSEIELVKEGDINFVQFSFVKFLY